MSASDENVCSPETLLDSEILAFATHAVDLLGTYNPRIARSQFSELSRLFEGNIKVDLSPNTLENELREIETTNRNQSFLYRESDIQVRKKVESKSVWIQVPGWRRSSSLDTNSVDERVTFELELGSHCPKGKTLRQLFLSKLLLKRAEDISMRNSGSEKTGEPPLQNFRNISTPQAITNADLEELSFKYDSKLREQSEKLAKILELMVDRLEALMQENDDLRARLDALETPGCHQRPYE